MVELLERPRDVREPAVTREAVGRCGELVLAHVVAPEREVARLSPKRSGHGAQGGARHDELRAAPLLQGPRRPPRQEPLSAAARLN